MPTFVYAYYQRGNAYRRMGEFGRALNDYDQAIQLDPDLAYLYQARGLARCWLGDKADAFADFSHRWMLAPDAVRGSQQTLARAGFYSGPHDGVADAATQAALKAWVVQGCP
jgi:tetratricopeptide (TPR) repeat protein